MLQLKKKKHFKKVRFQIIFNSFTYIKCIEITRNNSLAVFLLEVFSRTNKKKTNKTKNYRS